MAESGLRIDNSPENRGLKSLYFGGTAMKRYSHYLPILESIYNSKKKMKYIIPDIMCIMFVGVFMLIGFIDFCMSFSAGILIISSLLSALIFIAEKKFKKNCISDLKDNPQVMNMISVSGLRNEDELEAELQKSTVLYDRFYYLSDTMLFDFFTNVIIHIDKILSAEIETSETSDGLVTSGLFIKTVYRGEFDKVCIDLLAFNTSSECNKAMFLINERINAIQRL